MNKFIYWDEVKGELLKRFGFCGCGLPDEALTLMNDLLTYIEEFRSNPYEGDFQGPQWNSYCNAREAALQKIISENPDGVKYCLFYLIADKEITSHGGSVPGRIDDYEFKDKLQSYIDFLNRN